MAKNWAIAIGINQYRNLQPLQFAVRDAEAMRDYFLNEVSFQQVYTFSDHSPPIQQDYGSPLDSTPSFTTLKRFLRTRFDKPFLQTGDNLWFFFAGHGIRHEDRDYLMPIDGDSGDIDGTAIPIAYVTERLRRSGADNVVLLLDACRNEGRRSGVGVGEEVQPGVITLFSCSPHEVSYEIEAIQQGAFTQVLLQGLRLQGEGNCATVERLDQYLRHYLPQLNQRHAKPRQTPYATVEPAAKYHLILLPRHATVRDADTLKMEALKAETEGALELAEQLWIRVLAVSPADSDAIKAIRRISVTLSKVQSTVNKKWRLLSSSSTFSLEGRTQRPQTNLPLSLTRRQLFIGIAGVGIGGVFLTKAMSSKDPKPDEFSFEVLTLDGRGKEINRQRKTAKLFIEDLSRGIQLKMVYIPGGSFQMGSSKAEEGNDNERPQRIVTVESFYMGMYEVMQEQWDAVAALEKVELELKTSISHFKGKKRPVEQVCWREAIEFCDRFSKKTGREYRLPSEAEWEYACRSESTTPFHFGETLIPKLANYGVEPQGNQQYLTKDVGSFRPNAFGLYDMHGNVGEWCLDYWHPNYKNAPIDGSPWTTGGANQNRVIRGGSWSEDLRSCRSASRRWGSDVDRCEDQSEKISSYLSIVGFRVVCSS